MAPLKRSHAPKPDGRNPHGAVQNPVPREPRPFGERPNRDLSRHAAGVLPLRKTDPRK